MRKPFSGDMLGPLISQPVCAPDLVAGLVRVQEVVHHPLGERAVRLEDKVTYKGEHYISLIDANVWAPDTYPAGWEKQ